MNNTLDGASSAAPPRRFTWRRLVLVTALMAVPVLINLGVWITAWGDAYAVGWSTPSLLLALGGAWHLLRRQRGPRHASWYGLLLLYLFLALSGMVGYGADSRAVRAAMLEMAQAAQAAHAGPQTTAATAGAAASTAPAAAAGQPADEIPAPMRQAYQGVVSRAEALNQAYAQRLASAGIPQLLQADFLRRDANLALHQAAIAQVRSAPEALLQAHANSLAQFRSEVQALDIHPLARHQALAALDAFGQAARKKLEADIAAEIRTLDTFEQAVAVLRADLKAWHLEGDSLVFHSAATQKAFHHWLAALDQPATDPPGVAMAESAQK